MDSWLERRGRRTDNAGLEIASLPMNEVIVLVDNLPSKAANDITYYSSIIPEVGWRIFIDRRGSIGQILSWVRGHIDPITGLFTWTERADFYWTPELRQEADELAMRLYQLRAFF
jgi:hypothetical protein